MEGNVCVPGCWCVACIIVGAGGYNVAQNDFLITSLKGLNYEFATMDVFRHGSKMRQGWLFKKK